MAPESAIEMWGVVGSVGNFYQGDAASTGAVTAGDSW